MQLPDFLASMNQCTSLTLGPGQVQREMEESISGLLSEKVSRFWFGAGVRKRLAARKPDHGALHSHRSSRSSCLTLSVVTASGLLGSRSCYLGADLSTLPHPQRVPVHDQRRRRFL